MQPSNSRVTARIHRTEEGDIYHEYVAGDVAYSSIEALEAASGA